MTLYLKIAAATAMLFMFTGSSENKPVNASNEIAPVKISTRKIQVAILLDVSNSMDGLIAQAKSQLWNMVTVMGRAKCDGQAPQIEIALYEYGSPRNDEKAGYVKQIMPFTSDLDGLSAKLFALTTDGGSEYCGQVIHSSVEELKWDTSSSNYKVIFIAGNEDFLQGSLHYKKACEAANNKGIIVNTIYCGDRQMGIREHWNLLGACGNGSYSNINQGIQEEYIPTPYDSTIMVLNGKLNGTYVFYGEAGYMAMQQQASVDKSNTNVSYGLAAARVKVKGNKNLYRNSNWDLVDATNDDSTFIEKVDMKSLPDSLQKRSRSELKQIVEVKKQERTAIQNEITSLSAERDKFIAKEKTKRAATNNQPTLQSETERIIVQQARRFNMIID
jgi:hypothetical protein